MKKVLMVFGVAIGSFIFILMMLVLSFGIEWGSLKWQGYFGPKHEDVKRQIFRSTQSFNRGAETQLADYRLQYIHCKDNIERQAIMSTVRSQFADVNPDKISNPDIRDFLNQAISGIESPKIGEYQ